MVDSFFWKGKGKSHNSSHLPWYLIILPRCWLWLRYVYCPPNHAAGVLRISPPTKQVELIGIGRSVVTNGVSCLFHWDENMKDIYIKWLVLSDEHKLQRMVIFPTNYYMTSKWGMGLGYQPVKNTWEGHLKHNLGGGFKDFLFSPLFGQDFQVD